MNTIQLLKRNTRCSGRLLATAVVAVMAAFGTVVPAGALSQYASVSALSDGKWAMIQTTGSGIHQITPEQLAEMGFSDPSRVTVCGYSTNFLADNKFVDGRYEDVTPMPTYHAADGRVLFYAEGDVTMKLGSMDSNGAFDTSVLRNVYSTKSYCFVTDKEMPVRGRQPYADSEDAAEQTGHIAMLLFEQEAQNPGQGGADFHGPEVSGGSSQAFRFTLENVRPGTTAQLMVRGAVGEYTSLNTYTMPVSIPEALTVRTVQAASVFTRSNTDYLWDYGTGIYVLSGEGGVILDDTYDFSMTFPSTSNLQYCALDRAVMLYHRNNILSDRPGGLLMNFYTAEAGSHGVVSNATPTTCFLDVTHTDAMLDLEPRYDSASGNASFTFARQYSAVSSSNTAGRIVAFDTEREQLPVIVRGAVANQNIHGDAVPQMIIICTEATRDAARQLADIHRDHDGMDVSVYTQQEIFNEFSSGTPAAMGMRRMIKMFYDRDPQRLKYVLLYGNGSYDNRGILNPVAEGQLLTYQAEYQSAELLDAVRHRHINFSSDCYWGMLSDTYNPVYMQREQMNVAVGRLPVLNAAEGYTVNRKIAAYLDGNNDSAPFSRTLVLSDDGDQNTHLRQAEAVADYLVRLNPAITIIRAYNSLYPRAKGDAAEARALVTSSLIKGVGLMSYTGHGSPTAFTGESLWSQAYVNQTAYNYPPLALFSSCNTYVLDGGGTGIADLMVKKEQGGAIAAIASCRSVYESYNQLVNLAMSEGYGNADATTTVGDIYRNGTNSVRRSTTIPQSLFNTLCYNLCGDPALPVHGPHMGAEFTKIGEVDLTDPEAGPVTLQPNGFADIEGQVKVDGAVADDYNGEAQIVLYDGKDTAPVIILNSSDSKQDIVRDEHVLATAAMKVTDGKFSGRIFVPYCTYPGDANRIVVTTTGTRSDGTQATAMGTTDVASVADNTTEAFEGHGPQITEFYLNTPDFTEGDAVDADFTIHATVALGEAGVNQSSAIGAGARLRLDEKSSLNGASSALRVNTDGTATLTLPVSGIEDGRHSLNLSVSDLAGNRTSATIAFVVQTQAATATVSVDCKTARTQAVISADHDLESTDSTLLIIRDASNNTILSVRDPQLPYTWNLTDLDGKPVADGHYSAFLLLRSGNRYAATTPAPIVVVRNL